jgi:hypothetical protein
LLSRNDVRGQTAVRAKNRVESQNHVRLNTSSTRTPF